MNINYNPSYGQFMVSYLQEKAFEVILIFSCLHSDS